MAAVSLNASCSNLGSRTDFKDYIQAVDYSTNGTFVLGPECQGEVCSALYGFGNPDIHGIGLLVGYFLANVLGLAFAIAFFIDRARRKYRTHMQHPVITRGFASFYDCAVLLAFSVQIAATIMLARLNFGISANGMGDTTARITWSISILTLLPLVYAVFLPDLHSTSSEATDEHAFTALAEPASGGKQERRHSVPIDNEESQVEADVSEKARFLMFVACWIFSTWIFISKMISLFGSSQIGPTGVINDEDWDKLTGPCFQGVVALSAVETRVMNTFSVGTSLFLSVLTLAKVIAHGLHRRESLPRIVTFVHRHFPAEGRRRCVASLILVGIVPLLAIAQAWTILRLRNLEQEMAQTTQVSYDDNQWTFGQVVACTIFAPMLVEWCKVYMEGRSRRSNG